MAVNDELGQLERFLDAVLPRLAPGGRIAVISLPFFGRQGCQTALRLWSTDCLCRPIAPRVCGHKAEVRLVTRRPILPTREESIRNPRASQRQTTGGGKNGRSGSDPAARCSRRIFRPEIRP